MGTRGWVTEVAFVAVLGLSLAAPALTSTGQHLASGSGGSGSSSSGSSGSSGNGSSGSSISGSSGSSSSGSGGTTGPGGATTGHSSGSRSGGGKGAGGTSTASSDGNRGAGRDNTAYTAVPPVGTVLTATLRNLPPFVLLSCLVGLANGDVGPGPYGPDASSGANQACAAVSVRPLRDLSGPFSDPPQHVDPDRLELTITVDRPDHVVVQPALPVDRQNRLLLTLLAAALVVIGALAMALVVRRRPPPAPPSVWGTLP